MSQQTTECVFVRFPRRRGFYRVQINRATEQAIDRLKLNRHGFYELEHPNDEAILWRHAQMATERLKELESLQAQA